jgi:hypothetical protein
MGLFTAIVFFGALTAVITALRSSEDASDGYVPEPKRVPDPGSRDLHTVTGGTLGRAWVPSWG